MKVELPEGNQRTMTTTEKYLKDICELLIDSKLGYSDTARRADDPRLQDLLGRIGESRVGMISVLSNTLEDLGIRPPLSGTFKGTLHRIWIGLRDLISNTDDVNMVSECERGESYLIGRVDEALKDESVRAEVKTLLLAKRQVMMDNLMRIRSMNMAISEV